MKTILIGSGFSSLSAACYMARAGHEVTVLEKNDTTGGRARQWVRDGFRFDRGPTFYWMPDVFERFFADFGKKPSDYYTLTRLDPGYAIHFGPDNRIEQPAGAAALEAAFERIEPGSGRFLHKFLRSAEYNYRAAIDKVVYQPGRTPWELLMPETIGRFPQFLTSLSRTVRHGVKDDRLRQMLEFPVLFLGAKPDRTPSFYRFMNYADIVLGSWHVQGGMGQVATALQRLAESLGAKIRTAQPVREIIVERGRATAVATDRERLAADIVISGADYHHTESLLPVRYRNYNEDYWRRKVFAPSAILFYVAFGKRIEGVAHHTLFFDTSFEAHAAHIYDTPGWPEKPLFYTSFPSRTDASMAPAGCEAAVILIPTAAGLADTPAIRERYFGQVIDRMERLTGQALREHILFYESYASTDFMRDYHACKGNAYGLANILTQTAFLKPKICNRKLPNLFYTGQLTVPGPGVPPAIISGKIAAECALSRLGESHPSKIYRYGSTLQ